MIEYKNHSLLAHNTFGIEAQCRRMLIYESVEDAQLLCRGLSAADEPLLLLGAGSNLLLTGNYEGTVLTPAKRFEVHVQESGDVHGDILLTCWAGTTFDDVVAYAVEHGYHGAENLSLIPGEVGASAVQNIGAYGAEVKDIIHEVRAVEIATGMERVFCNDECAYGYRQSRFKQEWRDKYLITWVTYRLHTKFQPLLDYGNIRAKLQERGIINPDAAQLREVIIAIRNEKLPDPKVMGNAGSFFMNPIVPKEQYEALLVTFPNMPHYTVGENQVKIPAGWLIDSCGWKGRTMGRAGVHDKQALVLVNRGGATGEEVLALCQQIRHDVQAKFGITIYPEVNVR